jgi:hypothetical protein
VKQLFHTLAKLPYSQVRTVENSNGHKDSSHLFVTFDTLSSQKVRQQYLINPINQKQTQTKVFSQAIPARVYRGEERNTSRKIGRSKRKDIEMANAMLEDDFKSSHPDLSLFGETQRKEENAIQSKIPNRKSVEFIIDSPPAKRHRPNVNLTAKQIVNGTSKSDKPLNLCHNDAHT